MSSRDDVEAEEVVNNPGGAANDPGETFDLIRHYFDRKFDSLKTEIIAETHLAVESSRKRKFEDVKFKSKSNKVQFRFNCEIIDLIERAESSAKLKGNKHLEEAKQNIKNRNKLIRIADKSPACWLTVAEYEDDEVASDSDDQKKIRAAESRAIRRKKQFSESSKRNDGPYQYRSLFHNSATNPQFASTAAIQDGGQNPRQQRPGPFPGGRSNFS